MNETILIIEDSPEIRENSAELLELAGYKVISAEDGKAGLKKIHDENPDLILCDIMMPELDGYGVLRALRGLPDLYKIPFIFFTAKTGLAQCD